MHVHRLPRVLLALGLAIVGSLAPGCVTETELAPACAGVIWGQPTRAGQVLSVVGSWNAWSAPTPMRALRTDPTWQLAQLDLPPGAYGYLVVEEGAGRLDRHNGLTTFRARDGAEVSLLQIDACDAPRAQAGSATRPDTATVELELDFVRAATDAPLDPTRVHASALNGSVALVDADPDADTATVRVRGDRRGKQRVSVSLYDTQGRATEPVVIAAWTDPVAETWEDGIVYQVMIDRFLDDEGRPLSAPPTPGARAGGTLRGVTAALRDGVFASLSVSTLWLSPVYENPVEARMGRDDGHLYEGYHGYWPLASRDVDPRLGGAAALHELIDQAHAQGIGVLLDLVPNHVYEDNPRVAQGRGEGWFHEHTPPCVCGSPACPWSDFIQTCWFTEYLPDFRFESEAVMSMAVDDAVWWHETFGGDGFRIDAVPMMPRAATRRIAHALRQATAPRDAAFTIGEVFTGGGTAGTEDLRYYLGPDGLDSAFDFPLMWALRQAVAVGTGSFADVESTLRYTDAALQGSGAQMRLGRMIGNHDVTRFASEAAGDATADGWVDPPPQPTAAAVYERQRLALGLVLTLPGLPILYYGDEVGLAGASDPDNRRVLPDRAALLPEQAALRVSVARVARLRRCLPALRRGRRQALVADNTTYAFVRDVGDGAPALVVASSADTEAVLSLPVGQTLPPGLYDDALGGPAVTLDEGTVTVTIPPRGLAVFVPAGHACGAP